MAFSLFLSIRFFVVTRQTPQTSEETGARILSLEGELKQTREQLLAKSDSLAQVQAQIQQQALATSSPLSIPTVSPTATPISDVQVRQESLVLFSAVPAASSSIAGTRIPITLTPPDVEWNVNKLKLKFSISYSESDGGRQQGRIVILARGPETLYAYPTGVLNAIDQPALIAPNRGEYFSVSRFRAVEAIFGPVHDRTELRDIQIVIFDESSRLLLTRGVAVPQ